MSAIVAVGRLVLRSVAFLAGFFETRAAQSMVRLVAALFALAAAACALAAYHLAHRPHLTPELVPLIDALSRMATLFVVSGAVALLTRTRSNAPPASPPGDGP